MESIEIFRGICFSFIRSIEEIPEDSIVIDLVKAKQIISSEDLIGFVGGRQHIEKSVIWNNGGSWLRLAKLAVEAGGEHIYIYQQEKKNECLTNTRVVMRPHEASICFIPNYKCGYSSMWRFLRSNFESCAEKGGHTFSLNSLEAMEKKKFDFTFSFVRDPVKRLQSFYIDKFCREVGHHNNKDYRSVYEGILGTITPENLVEFVGQIPSDFADRHWKSTWDNLHHKDVPLFDVVYDIKSENVFLNDISGFVGRELRMPKANSTDKYAEESVRDFFRSEAARELVLRFYYKDFVLYEAVKGEGYLRS